MLHTKLHSITELVAMGVVEELFDSVPSIVFFVKDLQGRYLMVNRTLVERCNRKSKNEIIGRTVSEVFPAELADRYAVQDRSVLHTGQRIINKLELHLYANHRSGWCLTSKLPLRDQRGKVIGLAGLSRDIDAPSEKKLLPPELAEAIESMYQDFDQPIMLADLAAKAGLSKARFSRLIKRIFQLTPGQLLTQIRLQAAALRLRDTEDSIADIAHASGFFDHSAFTRQFKATTGLPPLAYRHSVHQGQK